MKTSFSVLHLATLVASHKESFLPHKVSYSAMLEICKSFNPLMNTFNPKKEEIQIAREKARSLVNKDFVQFCDSTRPSSYNFPQDLTKIIHNKFGKTIKMEIK